MRAVWVGLIAGAAALLAAACGGPPPLYKAIPTVPTRTVAIGAAAIATAVTLVDPSRAGRKDEKNEAALSREKRVTESVPSEVLDRVDRKRAANATAGAGEGADGALLPTPGVGCQLDASLLSDETLLPAVLAVCPPAIAPDQDLSLPDGG